MTQMPKLPLFNILESISKMSPKQRLIAKQFYLWSLCIKKGTMKGMWMRVLYIAEQCACCSDTVIRFLKEFKDLIKTIRRRGRTNSYAPDKLFFEAMEFMDKEKMLNKDRRSLKRWLNNMLKSELQSSYENVRICDPPGPNLRPNPYYYPYFKVQEGADQKSGNYLLDQLPLALWQKRKLMIYPEQVLVEAHEDYKWYKEKKEVRNVYGLLLSRAKAHVRK
jgi:hypothetical protein